MKRISALLLFVIGCSSGPIAGPGDDPAAQHLPDIPFPAPDPAMFAWLEEIPGRPQGFSRREIGVVLSPSTTVAQANELLVSLGATLVGSTPEAALLLLQLPDRAPEQLMVLGEQLATDPRLLGAAVEDALLEAQALPPSVIDGTLYQVATKLDPMQLRPRNDANWTWEVWDPAFAKAAHGGNWALKRSRFPQAWNLRDFLQQHKNRVPVVGIVDEGFTYQHEDLDHYSPPDDNPVSPHAGESAHDHGSAVLGYIAATWDNELGIAGAMPVTTPVRLARNPGLEHHLEVGPHTVRMPHLRALDTLLRLLREPSVQVVNNSYGYNLYCAQQEIYDGQGQVIGYQPCYDPAVHKVAVNAKVTWHEYVRAQAEFYRLALEPVLRNRNLILVSSAGNCGVLVPQLRKKNPWPWPAKLALGNQCTNLADDFVFSAEDNGPLSNLAVRYAGGHYLTVQAIDWNGALSDFSDRQGNLSAPGEEVRGVEANDTLDDDADGNMSYQTGNGTSYAAPMVTGLVAWLWALAPELATAQVQKILQTTGRGTERAIDAFAASVEIDRELHRHEIQQTLADLDDGSADGNQRWDLRKPGCENHDVSKASLCEVVAPIGPGDGRVDLRDFRVLRDSLLSLSAPTGGQLDGDFYNPKNDLNQDRCIRRAGQAIQPVLGHASTKCHADAPHQPPDENVYPRIDLNGDGVLDTETIAPFQDRKLTDLAVMAEVFGIGTKPITLGYGGAQLKGLLASGDLHLDLSPLLLLQAAAGADEYQVEAPGIAKFSVSTAGEVPVLTLPPGSKGMLVVRARKGGKDLACRQAPVPAVKAGEDVLVPIDQSCGPTHFWLEVEHAGDGECATAHAGYGPFQGPAPQLTVSDPPDPINATYCALYPNGLMAPHAQASNVTEGTGSGSGSIKMSGGAVGNGAEYVITLTGSAMASTSGSVGAAEGSYDTWAAFWIKSDLDPNELKSQWRIRVQCTGGANLSTSNGDASALFESNWPNNNGSGCYGTTIAQLPPVDQFTLVGKEVIALPPPLHFYFHGVGGTGLLDPMGQGMTASSQLGVTVHLFIEKIP